MSTPPSASISPFKIKFKPKQMAYNVYRVYFSFTALRHHLALFIETDSAISSGYLFHVIGDVNKGMKYEFVEDYEPHHEPTYLGQELIGVVLFGNISKVIHICMATPPPKRQLDNLGRKIYPDKPFRRCAEWVEDAIQALTNKGILQKSNEKLADRGLRPRVKVEPEEKGRNFFDIDTLARMDLASPADGVKEWLSRISVPHAFA